MEQIQTAGLTPASKPALRTDEQENLERFLKFLFDFIPFTVARIS